MSQPSSVYDHVDKRFRDLTNGNVRLEKLFEGCRWAEGPVWFRDGNYLVWSDIPNRRMLRWIPDQGTAVFRADSNFSNGNTRDRQGRLVTCEHGTRRVTRTEIDGTITVLAERFGGKRLNSPNDVVVKSDGTVWFTDPSYGILSDYEGFQSPIEQEICRVYRLDPETGDIQAVVEDMRKPNGLAFSPDESILYVAESGSSHDPDCPSHIRAYPVDGNRLGSGHDFADISPGLPDGIRTDIHGHVWSSAEDGVHCYAADGTLLGKILVPEVVANLAFGGPRRNRLFICATTSLYSIYLTTTGAQYP